MAENTAISWATHTFNPWMGCTKVSPACDGCYAEAMMDKRYGKVQWGPHGERVRTAPANWKQPLKWNRQAEKDGTRPFVFCASLADVFDNQVPPEWRVDLFRLIGQTPNLVWLLLTKRPQNIIRLGGHAITALLADPSMPLGWPRNAAIGTTVEDQQRADTNVFHLVRARHTLKPAFAFLSCEPLLGPITIEDITEIDWVITGGETDQGGHRARPTHPDWFRSLRDQCATAGVAYHHKQNGEWLSTEADEAFTPDHGRAEPPTFIFDDGEAVFRIGKKYTGRMIDGVTHDAFPEVR